MQFVKVNREKKKEKNLWILLWTKLLIRGRIKGDGDCFFRAVAQEITGRQEDHAELRVLVTSYMAHNPAQLSCYQLTSSETMGQYLRTTKMDQKNVWATEISRADHDFRKNWSGGIKIFNEKIGPQDQNYRDQNSSDRPKHTLKGYARSVMGCVKRFVYNTTFSEIDDNSLTNCVLQYY